jgi:hypothetical protein
VTHSEIEQALKMAVVGVGIAIAHRTPVPEPWSLVGPSSEREPLYQALRAKGIDVRDIPKER